MGGWDFAENSDVKRNVSQIFFNTIILYKHKYKSDLRWILNTFNLNQNTELPRPERVG